MTITEMVKQAHQTAREHGFWDDVFLMNMIDIGSDMLRRQYLNRVVGCDLMLTSSELGEAIEAWRHGNREEFAEELADTVIRIADLAGFLEIDLQQAITDKMEKNEKRPYKHGKEF